jgi:hypothetical protein
MLRSAYGEHVLKELLRGLAFSKVTVSRPSRRAIRSQRECTMVEGGAIIVPPCAFVRSAHIQ